MYYLGKLDVEKYIKVTDKKVLTDQVVITENRVQHIIERRGMAFYDKYFPKLSEIIEDPDYILRIS